MLLSISTDAGITDVVTWDTATPASLATDAEMAKMSTGE